VLVQAVKVISGWSGHVAAGGVAFWAAAGMVIDRAINAPAASAAAAANAASAASAARAKVTGQRRGGRHLWANLSIGSAPSDACRRIFDGYQIATKLQHLRTW
jgi:hypothetical protein